MSIAAVTITHGDGSTTAYNASADTDVARGTALVTALAATVDDDVVSMLSGTFDVGTTQIIAAAGSDVNHLITVTGASKSTTTVLTQLAGTSNHACIKPRSNQVWKKFTLYANNATTQQTPVGQRPSDTGSYSNALFSDMVIIGGIDGYQAAKNINAQARFVRCDFHSNFDAITGSISTGSSLMEFVGCTCLSQYPHPTYPYPSFADGIGVSVRAVINATSGTFTIYGGTYACGGGGSSQNSAVTRSNGTVNVFDATLSSAGTNALDLDGTITIGNTTYNAGKTNGTITDVGNAYIPGPPTDLVATAGGGQAALTWTDNATNETGFVIDYDTDPAFPAPTQTTAAANATSKIVGGLTAGTLYYFQVRSTNATGDSTNSNLASTTPVVAASTPSSNRFSIGLGIGL